MNMHRLSAREQIVLGPTKYKRKKKRVIPERWVLVGFFAAVAWAIANAGLVG